MGRRHVRRGGTSGTALGPVSGVLRPASSGSRPGSFFPAKDTAERSFSAGFSASGAFAFAEDGVRSPVRSRTGTGERPPVWRLHFFVSWLGTDRLGFYATTLLGPGPTGRSLFEDCPPLAAFGAAPPRVRGAGRAALPPGLACAGRKVAVGC